MDLDADRHPVQTYFCVHAFKWVLILELFLFWSGHHQSKLNWTRPRILGRIQDGNVLAQILTWPTIADPPFKLTIVAGGWDFRFVDPFSISWEKIERNPEKRAKAREFNGTKTEERGDHLVPSIFDIQKKDRSPREQPLQQRNEKPDADETDNYSLLFGKDQWHAR